MFINTIDRANVVMVQPGGGLRFLKKPGFIDFASVDPVRKKLKRDDAFELEVFGLVDYAHAAFAKLIEYFIVRYCFADHKAVIHHLASVIGHTAWLWVGS